MKNLLKSLWKDESAQGATEYIVLLVVVTAIVFAFKDKIIGIITEKTGAISGEMDKVFR